MTSAASDDPSLPLLAAEGCAANRQVHIPALNHFGLWVSDLDAAVAHLKAKVAPDSCFLPALNLS